jgi:hypothetical protein
MHKVTFYPLGNADSFRIDLANGDKLLIDYANVANAADANDRRIDLAAALRQDLDEAGRKSFDVVAFTHLDDDHVCGAPAFFHLEHAQEYQGDDRIKIEQLWVPAAAITDDTVTGDASIIQSEARYRLKQGKGIRVFSRPERLRGWLEARGIKLEDRRSLISDAGSIVPEFSKDAQQVEFFVHSPFASRENGDLLDRNANAIVLQATFVVDWGADVRFMLGSDVEHMALSRIVQVTRGHGNDDRLTWDLFKLPHHCSYLSLSDERGVEKTIPVPDVAWLFEDRGNTGGIIVSTSKPIPSNDDDNQPPHRQAANYYRELIKPTGGEFLVTMEHPTERHPEPLVVIIDGQGARSEKRPSIGIAHVTSRPSPRVG